MASVRVDKEALKKLQLLTAVGSETKASTSPGAVRRPKRSGGGKRLRLKRPGLRPFQFVGLPILEISTPGSSDVPVQHSLDLYMTDTQEFAACLLQSWYNEEANVVAFWRAQDPIELATEMRREDPVSLCSVARLERHVETEDGTTTRSSLAELFDKIHRDYSDLVEMLMKSNADPIGN